MNKQEIEKAIDELGQQFKNAEDCLVNGTTIELAISALEKQLTNSDEEYIKWLENMVILLAGCYQQTHDMLLCKAKEGNKAYFEMPTVQGFEMVMMVSKISKLKPNGTINPDKLEGFTNWLTEQYKEVSE